MRMKERIMDIMGNNLIGALGLFFTLFIDLKSELVPRFSRGLRGSG